jgi:enoyl-CoA hydratase
MRAVPGTRVRIERTGAVATLVIDRPPVNAVDPPLIEQFLALVTKLAADPDVRCIVVRGAGRVFVAGADIAVMRDTSTATQRRMRRWIDVQRVLEQAPKPVLAALNGHALGGGAELALACDIRVAAQSATIGFPEISLGLFPGAGGSQRLPRLLGAHRAKLIMMSGRRLTAAEAMTIGLVDEVVADAEFDTAITAAAADWAARPTRAIGLLKRSIDAGACLSLDEAMDVEWTAVQELMATDDVAEGLHAFLDKRRPRFRGR